MDSMERLLAEREILKDQEARIKERVGVIDEELRKKGYGTHEYGEYRFQVQRNRTLDNDALQARFPADRHPNLYKLTPDTAALKRHLSPAALDEFYRNGAPKIATR